MEPGRVAFLTSTIFLPKCTLCLPSHDGVDWGLICKVEVKEAAKSVLCGKALQGLGSGPGSISVPDSTPNWEMGLFTKLKKIGCVGGRAA